MIVTDTLNGHTVEDVRRNHNGSVTLYCDSGRALTLHVLQGRIEVSPEKVVIPDGAVVPEPPSVRMRLLEAFQGYMVNYAHYDDKDDLVFVCEPVNQSFGHREIKLAHENGLISELPPVSAIIGLPSLSIFGKANL